MNGATHRGRHLPMGNSPSQQRLSQPRDDPSSVPTMPNATRSDSASRSSSLEPLDNLTQGKKRKKNSYSPKGGVRKKRKAGLENVLNGTQEAEAASQHVQAGKRKRKMVTTKDWRDEPEVIRESPLPERAVAEPEEGDELSQVLRNAIEQDSRPQANSSSHQRKNLKNELPHQRGSRSAVATSDEDAEVNSSEQAGFSTSISKAQNGKLTPGRTRKQEKRNTREVDATVRTELSNEAAVTFNSGEATGAISSAASKNPSNTRLRPIRKARKALSEESANRFKEPQRMAYVEIPATAKKDQNATEGLNDSATSEFSEAERAPPPSQIVPRTGLGCHICGQQYTQKKYLRKHMNDPMSHQTKLECGGCDRIFYRLVELKRHRSETEHKSKTAIPKGAIGPFSESEKAKMEMFKKRFCNDYSVSEFDFNTLMTLLGRRDGSGWPHPDVTRVEMRDMFYDVLPDRNRKSLNRFRERYWQNVEQDPSWTEEQISELKHLVEQKGRKWVEIGRMLGRTQESVYQKWKNRIRQGDAQRFERWEEDEVRALVEVVNACKKAAGVSLDFSSDDTIIWTVVSDRMGKTRSPRQCSDFWRQVYKPREEAKARGEEPKSLTRGRSSSVPVRTRREAGPRATTGGKSVTKKKTGTRVKSDIYFVESDDGQAAPEQTNVSKDSSTRSVSRKASSNSQGQVGSEDPEDVSETQQGQDEEGVEESSYDHDRKSKMTVTPNGSPAARKHTPEVAPASFRAVNSSQLPKSTAVSEQKKMGKRSIKGASSSQPSLKVPESPLLPPLPRKSPRQVTSLTQAFNNTQVPTSARSAGQKTPGRFAEVEERPSPDIEIRSRPVRGGSPALGGDDDAEEDDVDRQQHTPVRSDPDAFTPESEAADSDREMKYPQMFSSEPLTGMVDAAEAESSPDDETESSEEDETEPPQMFSSAVPTILPDHDDTTTTTSSSSDDEDTSNDDADVAVAAADDKAPQMFSSTALLPPSHPDPATMFASTLPDPITTTTTTTPKYHHYDNVAQSQPLPVTKQNLRRSYSPGASSSSTSSDEARTIPPYDSDNSSGAGTDGEQAMVKATRHDFAASAGRKGSDKTGKPVPQERRGFSGSGGYHEDGGMGNEKGMVKSKGKGKGKQPFWDVSSSGSR